ncbi:MAG: hypothetical protein ACI9UU_000900 [Candidatus Azotimanducaceae bacterium]|jgi:hypothetical protein
MQQLKQIIQSRFNLSDHTELDAIVGVTVGQSSISVDLTSGSFELTDQRPDFTLYFDSIDTLELTLGNLEYALAAFSRGGFRSSGYILWSFQFLRSFSAHAVA